MYFQVNMRYRRVTGKADTQNQQLFFEVHFVPLVFVVDDSAGDSIQLASRLLKNLRTFRGGNFQ